MCDLSGQPFVSGRLIVTVFHNNVNLYTVAKIRISKSSFELYDDKIAVVGNFSVLQPDCEYIFYGNVINHARFGVQLQVSSYKKKDPDSKEGLIAYLSSSLFKGIGKRTARLVVTELGTSAISQILSNGSVLEKVKGLGRDKVQILIEGLQANKGIENAMIMLGELGITGQLSVKIFQAYKQQTCEIIKENPYQLIEDVDGIGFLRADEIGRRLGFDYLHPFRIRAAIFHCVSENCMQSGHTYVEIKELLSQAQALLNSNSNEAVFIDIIKDQLDCLEELGKVVCQDELAALPSLHYAELGIVSTIKRLSLQTEFSEQFSQAEFLLKLGELEERLEIVYDEKQRQAIYKALHSPFIILTGGPGTGKTTVIKGIVELYQELHGIKNNQNSTDKNAMPIILAAPTGRAAKRMQETTGLPAMTIHRLLGWNGSDGFTHDENTPIEGKLVIIDESSMIDTWLMNQLLKALPKEVQLILVGDEDQLPSVSPGQVLKDLLAIDTLPTVRLKTVFRQKEGSSVIELAHAMKKGTVPDDLAEARKDRSFFSCQSSQVAEVVVQVAKNAIKKGYSAKDVQVLAPIYRGEAGVDILNVKLQEVFNSNALKTKRELRFGDVVFRTGDKVLQLVNRPDCNIYNGDIGEIVSIIYAKENIDKQDLVYVCYDGIEVEYIKQDLIQLTHAFCCSIHKAQGSEFPIVILPVVRNYARMLKRSLIYTAVTRAKRFLILCGEADVMRYSVKMREDERKTLLRQKFSSNSSMSCPTLPLDKAEKLLEEKDVAKESGPDFRPEDSNTLETYQKKLFQTDPMIGMENFSPYDFVDVGES